MTFSAHERADSLKHLPPLEAISTWLGEDFSHRDEYNLTTAILRDRRILLDDDEISLLVHKARDKGTTAAAVLELLVRAAADEAPYAVGSTTA
ncbi:MAG: hypothetical protein HQ464_09310 [Planctomycetes bacterium]|nr:hypothetical protein [Planctomycetota bacterium]